MMAPGERQDDSRTGTAVLLCRQGGGAGCASASIQTKATSRSLVKLMRKQIASAMACERSECVSALVHWQVWFNKSVAIIRSGVERIFGVGKRSYGLGRARYRGIERVRAHFFMIAMAYNLRRAVTIVALRDGLAA